jgi:hypothetical protein
MVGRLTQLVRNRLACLDQMQAEPKLCQAINEQAQHHDQTECHDVFWLASETS